MTYRANARREAIRQLAELRTRLDAAEDALTAAEVSLKQAELTARNEAGGYGVAAADPAITGDLPSQHLQQAALLSDGAARAVDPFQLCDWHGLLTILGASGPGELIRQVRSAEATDPAGTRWPRNKIHDDATAILIQQ